jgi:hypothetical protein
MVVWVRGMPMTYDILRAGIGVGAYRDHTDAAARAVRIVRRQEPEPQASPHYLACYAEYRRLPPCKDRGLLLEAMQTPWKHLSELQWSGEEKTVGHTRTNHTSDH